MNTILEKIKLFVLENTGFTIGDQEIIAVGVVAVVAILVILALFIKKRIKLKALRKKAIDILEQNKNVKEEEKKRKQINIEGSYYDVPKHRNRDLSDDERAVLYERFKQEDEARRAKDLAEKERIEKMKLEQSAIDNKNKALAKELYKKNKNDFEYLMAGIDDKKKESISKDNYEKEVRSVIDELQRIEASEKMFNKEKNRKNKNGNSKYRGI